MALLRLNHHPSRTQLLVFSLAWLVVLCALGLSALDKGRVFVALACGTTGVIVPVLWAAAPPLVRWLFLGLSYATYPIGFVVSYVVLAVMFYLVVTSIGLVVKLSGRDPLFRKFDPQRESYWEPRTQTRTPADYLRQR